MTSISAAQGASQISPANERLSHQSNLVGDWKGLWSNTHQPIEFKVLNIRGATAQVEYTHNGHTERGTASVDGATITYGAITMHPRRLDGGYRVLVRGHENDRRSGRKAATPANQNQLVGTWIGSSATTGASATVQVLSINGRDAQVKSNINGNSQLGTGTVYKNAVMFGKSHHVHGRRDRYRFQSGSKTLTVAVKRFTPPTTTTTSVNKLA